MAQTFWEYLGYLGQRGCTVITLIIPTIPPRADLLKRMLRSVVEQTLLPSHIIIESDPDHTGAANTRNRALEKVTTPLVAFADDDDELEPNHLASLMQGMAETGADVIYPWYTVIGGTDPRHDRFGQPFDAEELRRGSYIPVNSLVRTGLAKQARFHVVPGTFLDDWGFYLRLLDLGAMFHHVPWRTFKWYHHDANTSGQYNRW